jgi:hypothetical protein
MLQRVRSMKRDVKLDKNFRWDLITSGFEVLVATSGCKTIWILDLQLSDLNKNQDKIHGPWASRTVEVINHTFRCMYQL